MPPNEIQSAAGQQSDLWFGVNVSGKIHLVIRTRDGSNKARLWWITWGVGTVSQLGECVDRVELDIPISAWKGILSAKLRGESTSDAVFYVSDTVNVDASLCFKWDGDPPDQCPVPPVP